MKKFLAIYIFAIMLAMPSFANDDKRKCIPTNNLNENTASFASGENIKYDVYYKWGLVNAAVAQAYMKVDTTILNGEKVWHTIISGRVLKFYETFFKVRETLEAWFTMDTFSPLRFHRESREGSYSLSNHSSFIWHENSGVVTANIETSRKGQFSLQKELTNCTLDIPTMFYLLRNVDVSKLAIGKSYPLSFIIDDDVYTLHCVYMGKEVKDVSGIGNVRCLKLGFEVVAGDVFSGDSDLLCWLTDDENRIPVLFKAPLKIGEVKGRLKTYEGLKHPFNALVK